MKEFAKLMLVVLVVTQWACHHTVVSTGVYGGHVSTGVSVHADGDAGALAALGLLGAMVGGAIYEDVHAYRAQGLSAIDVNIVPQSAEISLNGVVMGTAEDFDGFPNFLIVEPGTHTIYARAPGFKSYQVTVHLAPGEQVNLNKRMERGEDVIPRKAVEAEQTEQQERIVQPDLQPVLLRLTCSDPQASVYVDGVFVGTARQIEGLHGPLQLDPEAAVLAVVSPDHRREFNLRSLNPDPQTGVIELDVDMGGADPE